MAELDRLFAAMLELGGSDLHLLQGQPPKIRQHGHILTLDQEPLLLEPELSMMLSEICPPHHWDKFQNTGDADFAYALGDLARFRVNFYRHAFGSAMVARVIPTRILCLEELNAPETFIDIAEMRMGLVLVTGPTGSGKSTTLAAIIDHINAYHDKKIITIEDPIEFVHPTKRGVVIQREVGEHTDSFASGLRAAGREDCEVVLVGEMRDLETISLAVSAAEMGVLVFGTLHTNSAAKTLDRVVNVFPADQQGQIRSMLSTSLKAVISQQLVRTADGAGRVAVHEILFSNSAVTAAIRQGQIAKLNQIIQSNSRQGMSTMDDALARMVESGMITAHDAFMKAIDKNEFERRMGSRLVREPAHQEEAL